MEGRKINWMKSGILEADRVLTVSPYYAEELISGEARGCELDNIMRLTGITGIVNGMDVSEWDPSKDKYIAVKYDATTVSNPHPPSHKAFFFFLMCFSGDPSLVLSDEAKCARWMVHCD